MGVDDNRWMDCAGTGRQRKALAGARVWRRERGERETGLDALSAGTDARRGGSRRDSGHERGSQGVPNAKPEKALGGRLQSQASDGTDLDRG